MKLLSPQHISKLAADPERRTQPVPLGALDFSRPFIHEEWTQLFYTDLYKELTQEQRLCYNQLSAVRANEFVMLLESEFVDYLLRPLLRHKNIQRQPELKRCLQTMIDEEQRHYQMFVRLNRHAFPDLFENGRERFFSRLPPVANTGIRLFGKLARQLAFPMWYFMAMEESAITMARRMFRQSATQTLGDLEPHWVKVYVEHNKDEARHLHIDRHLIDACINDAGPLSKRLNAWLFQGMLHSSFARPKRSGSGMKVIGQLLQRRPELAPRQREMEDALVRLGRNAEFMISLFNREIMPFTFALFDATPELHKLSTHMVGYEPRH